MFCSQLAELLGRIRRPGHVGGGVLLGITFEVSKAHAILCRQRPQRGIQHQFSVTLFLLLVDQDVSFQLALKHHACLLAVLLSTMVVMEAASGNIRPNKQSLL